MDNIADNGKQIINPNFMLLRQMIYPIFINIAKQENIMIYHNVYRFILDNMNIKCESIGNIIKIMNESNKKIIPIMITCNYGNSILKIILFIDIISKNIIPLFPIDDIIMIKIINKCGEYIAKELSYNYINDSIYTILDNKQVNISISIWSLLFIYKLCIRDMKYLDIINTYLILPANKMQIELYGFIDYINSIYIKTLSDINTYISDIISYHYQNKYTSSLISPLGNIIDNISTNNINMDQQNHNNSIKSDTKLNNIKSNNSIKSKDNVKSNIKSNDNVKSDIQSNDDIKSNSQFNDIIISNRNEFNIDILKKNDSNMLSFMKIDEVPDSALSEYSISGNKMNSNMTDITTNTRSTRESKRLLRNINIDEVDEQNNVEYDDNQYNISKITNRSGYNTISSDNKYIQMNIRNNIKSNIVKSDENIVRSVNNIGTVIKSLKNISNKLDDLVNTIFTSNVNDYRKICDDSMNLRIDLYERIYMKLCNSYLSSIIKFLPKLREMSKFAIYGYISDYNKILTSIKPEIMDSLNLVSDLEFQFVYDYYIRFIINGLDGIKLNDPNMSIIRINEYRIQYYHNILKNKISKDSKWYLIVLQICLFPPVNHFNFRMFISHFNDVIKSYDIKLSLYNLILDCDYENNRSQYHKNRINMFINNILLLNK